MKPNVIWEIERADFEWLPASWAQLVEALRRHGLSTTSSLEDLFRDADRDGQPRIEVPISAAVERSRLASERSGVLTVVATARRCRELEDGGHVGPVAVAPFAPAGDQPVGANVTHRGPASPVSYGCLTSGLSARQIEELIRVFTTAFDLDDNVRLTLFGSADSAFDAAANAIESLARQPSSPDVSTAPFDALGRTRVDVLVSLETDSALRPWMSHALERGLMLIAPRVGGHRERLDDDRRLLLADSVAETIQGGGHPAIRVSMDSVEKLLLEAKDAHWFRKNRVPKIVAGRHKTLVDRLAILATSPPPSLRHDELTGWVTTWNTRCGIASHAKNQLASADFDRHFVLAARTDDLVGVDGDNVVRCWNSSKISNGLGAALDEIARRNVTSVMIHFNWGFFNHLELRDFVAALVERSVVVFIDMHSTIDPPEGAVLSDFASTLRACDRVFAHSHHDVDRLLLVGVCDNLFVQPLGVIPAPARKSRAVSASSPPLLVTFGYSLPNKGLVEFVEAVAILTRRGAAVRATMLNARHPIPASADTVEVVRRRIQDLGVSEQIEFREDYLDEAETLRLLSEADLIVNPYQATSESASAAVRYCMASRRPVLVTPLEIFDDLQQAVFRAPGTSADHIASGIEDTLEQLKRSTAAVQTVEGAAAAWLRARDITPEAARANRLARAIRTNRSYQALVDSHSAPSPRAAGYAGRGTT
jgi:glycosyltransferase involved in cell wall biosynthesis